MRVQGLVLLCLLAFDNVTAGAQVLTVEETVITDFRPVVARIEAMDVTAIPSRLQGVVSRLDVDDLDRQVADRLSQLGRISVKGREGAKVHRDDHLDAE